MAPEDLLVRPAPVELRLLGSLDVGGTAVGERAPGDPPHPLLRQPKRAAVLFYTLLEGGEEMVSRKRLVQVFWPGDTVSDSRAALRQSLRFLRGVLPDDSLLRRGNRAVGVDPSRVGCDVLRFRAFLARGRPAAALELYRGDLLEGFAVDAGPAFDAWVEGLRTELRETAVRAAWSLATEAERSGRGAEATFWARRALALAPTEEAEVRRGMALMARVGDHAAALGAYGALVERLEREGEGPGPLTRRIAEEVSRLGPDEVLDGDGGRRSGVDRRSEEDRREGRAPSSGADRRDGADRRAASDRRGEGDRRTGGDRRGTGSP